MSIAVSTKSDTFLLSTKSTSYAFGIDDQGLVRHLYWGKKLPSADELELPQLTEVSTNDPVFEITREEFPVHGGLRYKEHCLKAAFADGTRELAYQYCGYDVEQGDAWEELILHLRDVHYAFSMDLHYKLYPDYDLMERSVVVTNQSEDPIQIEQIHTAQFHIPYENLNFSNVHGHWGAEQQRFVQKVSYGKVVIENRRGISSHNHNPYFILDRDATETSGEVYFGALRLSGNFSGVVEQTPYFTTAASVAEMGALFIFPIFSRFMNKKKVFAIASFTPAIGLIGLLVAGAVIPTNIPVIIICGLFYKFGSGLTLGATTVMLADVIDYGEVTLGTRNESIVASFQTLLVKTASAVAGWLIGVGLTISGYVENVPQIPQTILGMRVLMGVVPSIVTVLAFVIYAKGYKLDSSRMEEISNQLKAKKVEN